MQLHYTPEEVRELVAEGACLNYPAPTARDVAEATDVLEGVEELIAKLPAGDRFTTLSEIAARVGDALWVPVAHNCRLSAGVSVEEGGMLSFAVRGDGETLIPYFAARPAAVHALFDRAAIDGADLPAPDENEASIAFGSAGAVVEFAKDGGEDILDGGAASGDLENQALCVSGSDLIEGAVDFALKGLAGDEPSDLAVEGLAYPEGVAVRYLGRRGGGSFDVARSEVGARGDDPERRTVQPGWHERLEELRAEGELPEDLLKDATAILDETGKDNRFAHPEEFLAELTRRRGVASLTDEDHDAEARAGRLGALEAGAVEPSSVARLASAGRAHLRAVGQTREILLVPEGAPPELVAEAAERSRHARVEEREHALERRQLSVLAALFEPARALSLEAVLGCLGGPAHKGLLRRLVKGGHLEARRIEGEVILCDNGAADSVFRRAARLAKRVRAQSFSNRKAAAVRARRRGDAKAFAAPVVPFGDEANHLPRVPEPESGPDPEGAVAGRSYLDAERSGEAVIGTYGRGIPGPSRSPRQRAAARRRVARIVARRKAGSGAESRRESLACKAAWKEALGIHLSGLPMAERLELFLKTRGRQEFAALKSHAADPDALERSARELAQDGRIKVCGRSSGRVFIEAVESLGHGERAWLRRELLAVMALAEPGRIEVPEGTLLARRVAAARESLAKTKPGYCVA